MIIILGKVSVPVPGTPVQLTTTPQYQQMTEMDPRLLSVQAVLFQTWKDNTGLVYIGRQGMVKGNGTKVMAVLAIPSTASIASVGASNNQSLAGVDLSALYIDADIADNGPLVSLLVT